MKTNHLHPACLAALLVALAAALPPASAQDAKQSATELREYLPTLLQKTLLENDRAHVAAVDKLLMLSEGLSVGGAVTPLQIGRVKHELLQAKVDTLHRQTAYQDALDQFKLRRDVKPEGLQKMEALAILPLTRHLLRMEEIVQDFKAARSAFSALEREKPDKLRPVLLQLLTNCALAKDTTFRKQLPAQWAAWEKHKDPAELRRKYEASNRQLLDRRTDLELKGQPVPQADIQSLAETRFQIDLGSLEMFMREYEKQPWATKDDKSRQSGQTAHFVRLLIAVHQVLHEALDERVARTREAWPEMPPLQLDGIDLVSCDLNKAEQLVAARFKQPEAAVAAKTKMRQALALTIIYRLQQQLFELAFFEAWDIMEIMGSPISPTEFHVPVSVEASVGQSLVAQRSLTRVRGQLIETCIGYQIARLELYHDLKLAPP